MRQATWLPLLALLPAGALAQTSGPGDRDCNQCSDLCYLVDQYWQKERGIKVWERYAASTPFRHRVPLPARVTDYDSFEALIYNEKLPNSNQGRTLPCVTKQEAEQPPNSSQPPPPPGKYSTGLSTQVTESCSILFDNKELTGDNERAWRDTHICKGSAEAELAHEQVHRDICLAAWERNRFAAKSRLLSYHNAAQSELQAWKRHRNRLRDIIRPLAMQCGWQPTEGQKNDPNSVPTEKQTREMEIGWKAAEALASMPR